MYNLLTHLPSSFPDDSKVDTNADTPKEFDVFFRDERQFLPDGKDFSDLTPEELETLRNKYRFDPMKPGVYQGITGNQWMT